MMLIGDSCNSSMVDRRLTTLFDQRIEYRVRPTGNRIRCCLKTTLRNTASTQPSGSTRNRRQLLPWVTTHLMLRYPWNLQPNPYPGAGFQRCLVGGIQRWSLPPGRVTIKICLVTHSREESCSIDPTLNQTSS